MTVAAFVVSILALVAGVAGLTWQIVNYLLTGARVKVDGAYSVAVDGDLPMSYTITARNLGRQPITVSTVGIDSGDGNHYLIATMLVQRLSSSLPTELGVGSSASWSVRLDALKSAKERDGSDNRKWRPYVRLATGKRVNGKAGISL